jgi:excisionase family DNA binding protein
MQENATSVQLNKIAYSIKELSETVGICERKIYYEIEQGNLKISRIGRRILIKASEIDRWLNDAEVKN